MLAKLDAGMSARAVVREFATMHSTVQQIKHKFTTYHTVRNARRKGRPEILIKSEKRYILRIAMKDRAITWDALPEGAACRVSRRMIRRTVRMFFKCKWKLMDRPRLNPARAKVRRYWFGVFLGLISDADDVSR
ncbi:hypothetical protein BKA56DRAFT_701355 [Ilyonectria sp. MPI-CAGE-AT-0026]|nr:hypothetical protein BKA56DRAFT_701355 [Ilyonectria sp. MPI-CAGE-AT-0026]